VFGFLQFAGMIGLVIVYIAGAIVAGILIKRGARQGGLLILVGFVLLIFNSLCGWFTNLIIPPQSAIAVAGAVPFLLIGINLLISMVGLILIIVGIWQLGIRPYGAAGSPAGEPPPPRTSQPVEPASAKTHGSGAQAYPAPEEEPLPGDDEPKLT
jgi:hypothetical protein